MKILNVTFYLSVLLFQTLVSADGLSGDEFIGKKWSDLPTTKLPGFTLPLSWKSEKKYSLRYYISDGGKEVVTVVESPDEKNSGNDVIVAALDLRSLTSETDKVSIGGTNDCELKANKDKDSLVIGIIKQERDKAVGKYKPSRAWLLKRSTMKFKEVPAAKVTCEPQSYEG